MKKIMSVLMAITLMFTVTFVNTGCFGSFALTKKVYKFNEGLGSKFVQEIAFLGMMIIPVYGVAAIVDLFILNLIEFWTDSNPVAMNPGDMEQRYVVIDGKEMLMTATKGKVSIVEQSENPSVNITMEYDAETATWHTYDADSLSYSIQVLNENGDAIVIKNGEVVEAINLKDRAGKQLMALIPAIK